MVLGHHVIFGAYGFWLPNDPRGSWSEFVGSWELFRYGTATTTTETHSLAAREHDQALRLQAKEALKYPAVEFTGIQARAMARGFARYAERSGLTVWACAILPDHVHLAVGQFRLSVEQLVIQLKGEATRKLVEEAVHPFADLRERNGRPPKCFARGQWKVFLHTPEDIQRSIAYIENNPIKEGKKGQSWSFITPFVPNG